MLPKIDLTGMRFYSRKQENKYSELRFLAVDLEMTGLDPDRDYIVSVGWVPIHRLSIELDEAFYSLIKAPSSVGSSAAIHGLHDHQVREGRALCDVLKLLKEKYSDYILIFHHADLDLKFLRNGFKKCDKEFSDMPYVDTMANERKRLMRTGNVLKWNSLTLASCLERHGLPAGRQHESLGDAFSCAQLFLCQVAKYSGAYIDI